MSYPMEEPYCEEWNEVQELCLKQYPDKCPHREMCLEQEAKAYRRADYADKQQATNRRMSL